MPLVRAEVRNEFALGAPELYREAKKDDPKEVLEGVAVAGLVGVLRQLGDLAEFAAEVFHGLQEEVTKTSSRSHKLMGRVQRIEAALSPLEKTLLAQRSHLHFAYTAGSNWHTRIRCEQHHFIYSDLPQFIMDTYEDCRCPPSLHLLDKFDRGGSGSCMKRYSDPTFFKRASAASGEASTDKILKDKKGRKIKKRRSWPRSQKVSRDASFSYYSGRMHFTQTNIGGQSSPTQTASTYDAAPRSDLGDRSNLDLRNGSGYTEGDFRPSYSVEPEERESRGSISTYDAAPRSGSGDRSNLDLRNGSGFIEGDFRPSYSVEPEEQESRGSISSLAKRNESDFLDYNFLEGRIADAHDDIERNMSQERAGFSSSSITLDEKRRTPEPFNSSLEHAQCSSPSVTWGEKRETLAPTGLDSDHDDMEQEDNHNRPLKSFSPNLDLETLSGRGPDFGTSDEMVVQPSNQCVQDPESGAVHLDDIESDADSFMDALNTIESESEADMDCRKKQNLSKLEEKGVFEATRHNSELQSSSSESNALINGSCEPAPVSITRKSPNFIKEAGAEDERNSVSQSSSPKIVSNENGNPVDSISSTIPSDSRGDGPGISVTNETRSTPDTYKQAPEASNVTSVTFWTNGGLLGLQPSKPPDFNVLNALPQNPECRNDGKDSSYIQQDQRENFKNVEEGIDSSNCDEYQESGASFRKTSWKISPADLDINLGNLVTSFNQNNANSTGSNVRASGGFFPANSAVRKHQESTRTSSQMFDLSSRLLSSGSDKKLLLRNSPILSPPPSPPLQHMKVSFQPIGGFESSKLKLKFPDRNTNNESGIDNFPSFQLVPETRYNVGVDSDADTFYRSSPSLSDDYCHSESNSEQWESSGSPTKDHDLYDALRRISLTESVSENGTTNHDKFGVQFFDNGVQNSESRSSFDIQSLGSINHSFRMDLVEPQRVTDSSPPPIPPVQWRGTTPHLDSTISQPKPAPFNEDRTDSTNEQKSKQFISLKSNGRREANQGKNIDETDFLQQIRMKSFNLRPIGTTKPTVPSGASAAVQVTAILEKANAIRQAVASDGEDNWSDT